MWLGHAAIGAGSESSRRMQDSRSMAAFASDSVRARFWSGSARALRRRGAGAGAGARSCLRRESGRSSRRLSVRVVASPTTLWYLRPCGCAWPRAGVHPTLW